MSDIAFFLFNIDTTSSASYGSKRKVSVIFFIFCPFGFRVKSNQHSQCRCRRCNNILPRQGNVAIVMASDTMLHLPSSVRLLSAIRYARFWASVRCDRIIAGTSVMPISCAAAMRPCPVMISRFPICKFCAIYEVFLI